MILAIESLSGERKVYRIHEPDDFRPIFERYPTTKSIALFSKGLEDTARNIAEYLSSKHLNAWVESDLNKGIGTKLATLGMIAGAVMSPATSTQSADYNSAAQMAQARKVPKAEAMGRHPADAFLWNLKQIESSGGTNVNHDPVSHGQFKGEKAMGRYGLLKPTVKDIVTRMRSKGKLTPDIAALEGMSRDGAHKFLMQNPHTELKMARFLAEHVLSRHNGDVRRAAYSWLNGHNLTPDRIHEHQLSSSDYVQKFNKYNESNPYKNKLKPSLAAKAMNLESKHVFKARLHAWVNSHAEKDYTARKDAVHTNDRGRLREPELDAQDNAPVSAVDKIQAKLAQKK